MLIRFVQSPLSMPNLVALIACCCLLACVFMSRVRCVVACVVAIALGVWLLWPCDPSQLIVPSTHCLFASQPARLCGASESVTTECHTNYGWVGCRVRTVHVLAAYMPECVCACLFLVWLSTTCAFVAPVSAHMCGGGIGLAPPTQGLYVGMGEVALVLC